MSYLNSASDPLNKKQKFAICLLLFLSVIFGSWVELRGALQHTRKTDVGVYFRAAWAARTGNDLYSIKDDRGLHYIYPPLFAILMSPLADPPSGMSRDGYIPYEVSLGIWYIVTLVMGFLGAHILANALEATSADPTVRGQPRFCQRWVVLRIIPLLILLPAIGRGQMRGQVDMLLVLLLCCAAAALLRSRRFRAGLWIAAAICVKIIPFLLLLLPVWRRDWRMLYGAVIGLVIGLLIIPFAVLGPQRVLSSYQTLYSEVILGGVSGNAGGPIGRELTGITSTDSNAPMVIIHNIIHPIKRDRPKVAAKGVRLAHWLIAVLLIIMSLYAGGWRGPGHLLSGEVEAKPREILFLGVLLLTMLISSPVFHPHYVSIAVPLVMVVLSILWDRYSYPNIPFGWKVIFWSIFLSHILTSIDRSVFLYLRTFGLVLLTTLMLWIGCIDLLRRAAMNEQTSHLQQQ
jgi:alpha-1,2-mannosyltransferase